MRIERRKQTPKPAGTADTVRLFEIAHDEDSGLYRLYGLDNSGKHTGAFWEYKTQAEALQALDKDFRGRHSQIIAYITPGTLTPATLTAKSNADLLKALEVYKGISWLNANGKPETDIAMCEALKAEIINRFRAYLAAGIIPTGRKCHKTPAEWKGFLENHGKLLDITDTGATEEGEEKIFLVYELDKDGCLADEAPEMTFDTQEEAEAYIKNRKNVAFWQDYADDMRAEGNTEGGQK